MYKNWPDLTNGETIFTILALAVMLYFLYRWAAGKND